MTSPMKMLLMTLTVANKETALIEVPPLDALMTIITLWKYYSLL